MTHKKIEKEFLKIECSEKFESKKFEKSEKFEKFERGTLKLVPLPSQMFSWLQIYMRITYRQIKRTTTGA